MKVAVLGAGPSGLVAAWAARVYGHDVEVFTRTPIAPSDLYGCQYLHAPVVGISDLEDGHTVSYELRGSTSGYKEKVYGLDYQGTVSPEDLIGEHKAWDIREAYSRLWKVFQPHLWPLDVKETQRMAWLAKESDMIISTVPAPSLCLNRGAHHFTYQSVWALGDAPELGQRVDIRMEPFQVVCNGDPEPSWYRAANVFGYATVEWPGGKKPPIPGVAQVKKPLTTNCDCYPDILRLGRYGAWEKGKLVSDVWTDAQKVLA